jgi:hypothetical protein
MKITKDEIILRLKEDLSGEGLIYYFDILFINQNEIEDDELLKMLSSLKKYNLMHWACRNLKLSKVFKEIDDNGVIRCESEYFDGNLNNKQSFYNKKGDIVCIKYYYYGKLKSEVKYFENNITLEVGMPIEGSLDIHNIYNSEKYFIHYNTRNNKINGMCVFYDKDDNPIYRFKIYAMDNNFMVAKLKDNMKHKVFRYDYKLETYEDFLDLLQYSKNRYYFYWKKFIYKIKNKLKLGEK